MSGQVFRHTSKGMKALILSLLAALTLMTSVGLGHARGSAPAAEGIVLCQGHVITTIWIDAQGNEVEGRVLCPDAALGLLAHATSGATDMVAPLRLRPLDTQPDVVAAPVLRPSLFVSARGPPAPV